MSGNTYICVNDEQREIVHAIFHHNGWEVQELNIPPSDNSSEGIDNAPDHHIPQIEGGGDQCIYCLCKPCITNVRNQQFWWEDFSHEPSRGNSKRRKIHHKKLWVMLHHRGVWKEPRYIYKERFLLLNKMDWTMYGVGQQGVPILGT